MNIAEHVERGRIFFPDKPALIYQDQAVSYTHLNEMANRFANALRGLGVRRGDRVALLLPNTPAFVVAYLGAVKMGAILVSLNTRLKHGELEFLLNDCGARVLVTTEALRAEVAPASGLALEHIIVAEGAPADGLAMADLLASASAQFRAIDMDRNDPAAILYSSGTTGFPKGVTLSHGNVISNAYSKNHYCGMGPDDRMLLYLPLFHCFGQNVILNSGLNAGATVVLHREFDPEHVMRAIVDEQVTMLFGVPTVFILLHDRASNEELASLRYCFSAAAMMPPNVARAWLDRYGLIINEGYGLTESSPFACYNHAIRFKLGSVGSPIENVEMKILDVDSGEEVPTGETGEIAIKGPNVMLGYWNRPEETAQVLKNGWLHTGDLGQVDDEGYFYLVDRLKDMINVAGHKVYPAEVEKVIAAHPSVAEVVVYGVADERTGERVGASIVLAAGKAMTEEELLAFCHDQIAAFKLPTRIEFVRSLAKNATGKALRRAPRDSIPPG